MKNKLDFLSKLYIKLAQQVQVSAQPGDIERVLKSAGLWEQTSVISGMLGTLKVPGDIAINIKIMFDKMLTPNFIVYFSKPHETQSKLVLELKKQFSLPMKEALRKANIKITDSVKVDWLTF